VKLIMNNQRVIGARCHDLVKDEPVTISADMVVNAAGAWAGQIAALAGVHIPIVCSKGSMIATDLRVINTALTRLHWPSDCDSVLPTHTVSVLGCTDVVVESPDLFAPEPRELQRILDECGKLVPVVRELRQIRVWAGVRALFGTGLVEGTSGGGLSRTHAVIDHQPTDGVPGILSVVGGKWTTYRLIAQQATDRVCETLGTPRPCRTHLEPLPGAEGAHYYRHTARLARIEMRGEQGQLVCECEMVTQSDVQRALIEERATGLDDVRRITRLGMGPCQGGFCTYRGAGLRHELRRPPAHETCTGLGDFIQERWKGVVPIAAGDQLRQARLNELIFCGVLGVDRLLGW
jgi:glycerol-3-phosphate dehydrogenase